MACSPDAPKNTASRFLGAMVRYFEDFAVCREKCISYQDLSCHNGTIYKASNWTPEYFSRPRNRDRSGLRVGTNRKYRSDCNSSEVAAAGKIRWAYDLDGTVDHAKIKSNMEYIQKQINRCRGATK